MKEAELYPPIKDYFERLGYCVEGEVKDTDILVRKSQRKDILINQQSSDYLAIELKLSLNLKVILQAVRRQQLFELVYIAVPVNQIKTRSSSYRDKLLLLKRLGIGVLAVDLKKITVCQERERWQAVKLIQHPLEYALVQVRSRQKKKKQQVIDEFEQRRLKINQGGSQGKHLTAYRQSAYFVLYQLSQLEIASAAQLRETGTGEKTHAILYNNYYGWFYRQARGRYGVTEKGQSALEENKDLISRLIEQMKG